jgi:hypothetical protein
MKQQTTIVERLRNRINDAPMPTEHLLDEAANRIEALEAALRAIADKHLYADQYQSIARAALAPEQGNAGN